MGPAGALGTLDIRDDTRLAFEPPLNDGVAFLSVWPELPKGYSDPRVELWAAEPSGQRLDPHATAPLLTIPLAKGAPKRRSEVGAWLDPHGLQDWPPTWSVLVADRADGERVVLDYRPNGRELTYRGAGIDWLLHR